MKDAPAVPPYFPQAIQLPASLWREWELGQVSRLLTERSIPSVVFYRQVALHLNNGRSSGPPVQAAHLSLFATLLTIYRFLIEQGTGSRSPELLLTALKDSGHSPEEPSVRGTAEQFVALFPPLEVLEGETHTLDWLNAPATPPRLNTVLRELLLLEVCSRNRALDPFRRICDDSALAAGSSYRRLITAISAQLATGPYVGTLGLTIPQALEAPLLASPDSLAGQVEFIKEQWGPILPPHLLEQITIAFDLMEEEQRPWGGPGGGPGVAPVLRFGNGVDGAPGGHTGSSVFGGYDYPEYEQFSADADWMSHVVLMAKMVYVWLDQLSRRHGYPITRLDQIPDHELDYLATAGFTGLWLIGIWERSPASQRIKQLCGNPEAIASAYSLYDYEIAADLGGWEALTNLRERAGQRGIRLASDMVPNHTGIYSRWLIQHPDWFVQTDYPPFPTYRFTGENLSHDPGVSITIEDGYWSKTDAAVVFRYEERYSGRTRYIYHGNDGTSIPWNDTAQLNYLLPQVREAVIQTILHVARNFPIIRFDAAMTLAKKHFQRLWYPVRGLGGGIPSRSEHGMSREEFDTVFPVEFWREVVDRVAVEAPGTLLLAEAFWLMEGYFVRTLGMHRVYNSAFMNMLKEEENSKYRQTIRNVLEFNHEILKRFVNFMNNPDEKTAVEQFGSQGKYFGVCIMLATMPGLPMFGHGQIEGLREKYGMEYKRAYWDEDTDQGMVQGHEMWVFPLLRLRPLFSGSEHFVLYDFIAGDDVNENVFAYSNRYGEQRALVLYHNSYATTAGWLRQSTLSSVADQPPYLLAQGLDLANDPEILYRFRDLTDGNEYLRSSQELWDKGIYAELEEYQFHVFLDFNAVQDDEQGSWHNLCVSLNGRGVKSLEEERKQLQYGELNRRYRVLLEQIPLVGESPLSLLEQHSADLIQASLAFYQELSCYGTPVSPASRKTLQTELLVIGRAISALPHMAPSSLPARTFIARVLDMLATPATFRLLITWLVLKDSGIAPAVYGLEHSFRGQPPLPTDEESAATLLSVLIPEPGKIGNRLPDISITLNAIFRSPVCRQFMGVHESRGIEWFNQERYEQLLVHLALLSLARYVTRAPGQRALTAWMTATEKNLQRCISLAASAGYQTGIFLNLLTTLDAPAASTRRKSIQK